MENANKYAQLRLTIAQLESEAKELEAVIISDIQSQEKKNVDTELGKITIVETKVYTYSPTFLSLKKDADIAIKTYSEPLLTAVKEAKEAEEATLTPETKVGLRFTANK